MEQQIMLASKLYRARNSVKKLFGADWKKEIEPYTNLIKLAMEKHSIDNEIKAAMKLIEEYKDMDGADVFTVKILAATVELIEPTVEE